MTIEILNDFIHQDLSYNQDILVESFQVYDKNLHLVFVNKLKSVRGFGEIVSLERYQNWLSQRRDNKLNKLV